LDEKVENNIMLAQKFNDYLNALFSQFSVNAPTTPIGEIIKKVGKLCKNNEWKGQPVIDLSSMPRSNVVISNYSNGDKFTTNIHTLSDNTLLYGSIRPYFKKCGFAVGVSFVTGTVHSFKAINESLYYWILSVIQSEDFHNFCVIKSQGTKMPVIKWEAFSSIEIPLPSGDELEKFNTLIAPLYYKVSQGIIENRKLKELKEYYLKRYFI
jgi:type I restriction enzyme S subunit